MRRLLDELESEDGKSSAALPSPLAAGAICEPVLCNDEGKSVLEELLGMCSELQEGQARLQAVHGKTKVMQAQVTKYVEQRLRDHNEDLENRIAQEVRKQMDVFMAFAAQAPPSTLLASQSQHVETMPRMNSCVPGPVVALSRSNSVLSEQQEDHLDQDLLVQQPTDDSIRQQLVAIEQRLEAAITTAELAAPSLLDMSRCEASVAALLVSRSAGNASRFRTIRTCSGSSPRHRGGLPDDLPASPPVQLWCGEGGEQCQKSVTSSPSPRSTADKTSPRWQLQRKASGSQSLADILEHRRRTCEGLPPPSPDDSPVNREQGPEAGEV